MHILLRFKDRFCRAVANMSVVILIAFLGRQAIGSESVSFVTKDYGFLVTDAKDLNKVMTWYS